MEDGYGAPEVDNPHRGNCDGSVQIIHPGKVMKDKAFENNHVSQKAAQIFDLFVLNTEVELAGVIAVAAESADDARAQFEATRSASQHLLSVRPASLQAI